MSNTLFKSLCSFVLIIVLIVASVLGISSFSTGITIGLVVLYTISMMVSFVKYLREK